MLVVTQFGKTKRMILRYFYPDTPVPVLFKKVRSFLYRNAKASSSNKIYPVGTYTTVIYDKFCNHF